MLQIFLSIAKSETCSCYQLFLSGIFEAFYTLYTCINNKSTVLTRILDITSVRFSVLLNEQKYKLEWSTLHNWFEVRVMKIFTA